MNSLYVQITVPFERVSYAFLVVSVRHFRILGELWIYLFLVGQFSLIVIVAFT